METNMQLDRSLVNPHFDGYKLSLEKLPTYQYNLPSPPVVVEPAETQYSFQHVKAFSQHNALVLDPWHADHIYYIDQKWNVVVCHRIGVNDVQFQTVFSMIDKLAQEGEYFFHPSLHFASSIIAVLSDGNGKLHILNTKERPQNTWILQSTLEPLSVPFNIHHARSDQVFPIV